MDLVSENIKKILIILVPITLILVYWFYHVYQNLKMKETKKLQLLNLEFTSEKELFKGLQHSSKKLKKLESKTQYTLLKIKVDILNIDFSLKEILKANA